MPSSASFGQPDRGGRAPLGIVGTVADRIADEDRLDRVGDLLTPVSGVVVTKRTRGLLEGDWLGHAAHPMLTSIPLGCWFGAALLDLTGGRASRHAAHRLTGLGVVAAVPAIATGLAEWRRMRDARASRVAVVHAGGALVTTVLYAKAWRLQRGHPVLGALLSVIPAVAALATGALGGHLAVREGVGRGRRGDSVTGPRAVSDADDDTLIVALTSSAVV